MSYSSELQLDQNKWLNGHLLPQSWSARLQCDMKIAYAPCWQWDTCTGHHIHRHPTKTQLIHNNILLSENTAVPACESLIKTVVVPFCMGLSCMFHNFIFSFSCVCVCVCVCVIFNVPRSLWVSGNAACILLTEERNEVCRNIPVVISQGHFAKKKSRAQATAIHQLEIMRAHEVHGEDTAT